MKHIALVKGPCIFVTVVGIIRRLTGRRSAYILVFIYTFNNIGILMYRVPVAVNSLAVVVEISASSGYLQNYIIAQLSRKVTALDNGLTGAGNVKPPGTGAICQFKTAAGKLDGIVKIICFVGVHFDFCVGAVFQNDFRDLAPFIEIYIKSKTI